jgi:hypothetical protein
MKNKPEDLHNHLFAEIERLSEVSLDGDDLYKEAVRAKAICEVAMQVISHEKQILKSYETVDGSFCKINLPNFMGGNTMAITEKPTTNSRNPLLLVRKNA